MSGLVPFIEYLNAVDALLQARYGITSNDADMAQIAAGQDAGDTPEKFVDWFGEHYDLTPLPQA
jgi:hypothetical protein